VLVDTNWQGQPRKLLLQANRNGFFYILDRTNGKLLLAKPFLKKLNWAEAIGKDGRPILNTLKETAEGETCVCPGFQGGANWFSTSFNPGTRLYYFQALERCNLFSKRTIEWQAGKGYMGGAARPAPGETFDKVLRAINIQTGEITWELPQIGGSLTASAGTLSTTSASCFSARTAARSWPRMQSPGKRCGIPHEPHLASIADDLHVRQQAIRRGRRGPKHHRLRPPRLICGTGGRCRRWGFSRHGRRRYPGR
jgi:hypothetical protein